MPLAALAAGPASAAAGKPKDAARQPLQAGTLNPPKGFKAQDYPYDAGGDILLTWQAMPYDGDGVKYKIMIATVAPESPWWTPIETIPSDSHYKADIDLPFWSWRKSNFFHAYQVNPRKALKVEDQAGQAALKDTKFYFKLIAENDADENAQSEPSSATPRGNLFNLPRLNTLLFVSVFCGLVLWFISHARKKDLFLRRIPGLDAVEEAIGRATEMGRPIFFLTGRKDIDEIPTIAASLILGEIAKKVAEYDTILKVPHTYAMTYSMCQEITKQAYSAAGRPDAYREDCNFFITDDQFAYTAAVNGMMVREKPAACFYMGYYYAESLLLAEVGSSVGAIQIAGTDAEHQLPFFFITCDYTLIGEELYAAGAYLSREPVLVGTLRGQDVGKAFTMIVVFLGVILSTLGVLVGSDGFVQLILEPFKSF